MNKVAQIIGGISVVVGGAFAPVFADNNGLISVAEFETNGAIEYVQISDEQYAQMGLPNESGYGANANPYIEGKTYTGRSFQYPKKAYKSSFAHKQRDENGTVKYTTIENPVPDFPDEDEKKVYKSAVQLLRESTPEAEAAVAITNTSGITSSASGATSYTLSHTTASGDTYLATQMIDWTGDTATGCTFNGTSMTQLVKETRTPDSGSLEIYFYGLGAPAITTANVVCSRSGTTAWISVGSVSLSGTATATTPLDATATETGSAFQSSDTLSITTVADNTAVLIGAVADNCNIAASTNATEVLGATGTQSDCSIVMRSSTFPKTPTGSASYSYTFGVNSGHAGVAISIAPASVAVATPDQVIIFD